MSQRPFHHYPLQRFADSSNSNSADQSTSAGQSSAETSSSEQAAESAEPTNCTAAPLKSDTPSPPPKREVDPKDHEIAELKVSQL